MSMTILLEVANLNKSFAAMHAVKDLSFTMKRGRCTALLGPNGAGKTTTLRMLAGLLSPSSGEIRFADGQRDVRAMIGYLPQSPAFYGWMSGREYLVYAARLSGASSRDARARADELLGRVGLLDARHRRIAGYSGGMKQRLGIAQAMIHRPALVMLDEPVSALDPIGRREVLEMLRELKRDTTVLFSTHVLPDAEEVCDDLLIMHDGRLVVAGDKAAIMEEHRQPVIRIRSEQTLEPWQQQLAGLTGVESAACTGDSAELSVHDREQSRAALLEWAARHSIPLRRLEVAELSLEDLFMKAVSKG